MRRRWLLLFVLVIVALPVGRGVARFIERGGGTAARPPHTAIVLAPHARARLHVRPRPHAPGPAIDGRTAFGSRRALPVLRRRGRWVKVLGDGGRSERRYWLVPPHRTRSAPRPARVLVDLGDRRLTVLDGARRVATWPERSGGPGAPTPPGTYAITDELRGARFSAAYGCCILALSGRQRRLPAGWQGGNRLAIHATPTGRPQSSIGCVTLADRPMRRLMRLVGPGTIVTIRR